MIKNTHAIFVTYYGPTTYKASKIGLHSIRFNERIYIPFLSDYQTTMDNAEAWLNLRGYNCLGMSSLGEKGYVVFTDTFESLRLTNKERIADRAKRWFSSLSTTEKNRITIEYNTDLIVYAYKNHIANEADNLPVTLYQSMDYIQSGDGYSYYQSRDKKLYNIVRDGQERPVTGYYSKDYILKVKGVKDLFLP